jgi:hypothetical protein
MSSQARRGTSVALHIAHRSMRLAAEGPGPPGYIISCMLLGIVREVVGLVSNGNERKWGGNGMSVCLKSATVFGRLNPQRSFLSVESIYGYISKFG